MFLTSLPQQWILHWKIYAYELDLVLQYVNYLRVLKRAKPCKRVIKYFIFVTLIIFRISMCYRSKSTNTIYNSQHQESIRKMNLYIWYMIWIRLFCRYYGIWKIRWTLVCAKADTNLSSFVCDKEPFRLCGIIKIFHCIMLYCQFFSLRGHTVHYFL